jgi:hypothetical protein
MLALVELGVTGLTDHCTTIDQSNTKACCLAPCNSTPAVVLPASASESFMFSELSCCPARVLLQSCVTELCWAVHI